MKPTLEEVFGNGATQDLTFLHIPKSHLVASKLTAKADNTAESLLVAIVLAASGKLTADNQTLHPEQQVVVEANDFAATFVTRNNVQYLQQALTVTAQKLSPVEPLDPDSY